MAFNIAYSKTLTGVTARQCAKRGSKTIRTCFKLVAKRCKCSPFYTLRFPSTLLVERRPFRRDYTRKRQGQARGERVQSSQLLFAQWYCHHHICTGQFFQLHSFIYLSERWQTRSICKSRKCWMRIILLTREVTGTRDHLQYPGSSSS